ncbi:MAG: OmpA family protein [Ferruginibacter sp.]
MKKIIICIFLLSSLLQTNAQNYTLDGNEVVIAATISFETGSDKLRSESTAGLEIIKQYLADKSYISLLRVECHTDNTGNINENQILTEKRALAICKKLVEMGVDCKRLLAVGFGGNKPLAQNNTAEGRAQNRRVNFINVAIRGKLIGGLPADGGGNAAGDTCN